MKKFLILSLLTLFISCNKTETKIDNFSNKEILDKSKYQVEVFQIDNSSFTSIILNKSTGKVFIAKNAVGFYEATNKSELKSYKTPAYNINVFSFTDGSAQILLTNLKTSEMYMYIVGHTADFYEVNANLNSLENKE